MNRIPLNGQIEITNICNFKCVHCYLINSKNQVPTFLSFDIIKSVIDEAYEMGCETITLTGGECLLHPDFEKIYTYIWKKGIKVDIFTNASLITEATISLFKEYMPNSVEVSLYGDSEAIYKEVTKSCNYENVINALKLLQENMINLQIKIIVLKQNHHRLEEMKKLASKYTNNLIRVSYDLMPAYDFSLDVLSNRSITVSDTPVKNRPRTNKKAFNCWAGKSFFCVNYKGDVTLCSFCSFSAMNLKDYSFHQIWEAFGKDIKLSIPKDSECHDCTFLNECENCPARSWMFNKKVGLYPIPQCKKIKKSEGGSFMQTSKEIFPESFVSINDITYFRLKEGQIAVENASKVTINSTKDDVVELITLGKVNFWKVNDKIYALASSSCVTLPEDTEFVDTYHCSRNYPEGRYVKYLSSKGCGILYVSETEVSQVISYESGYTDICFEVGLFYADSKEGENKYHILDEGGKILWAFPTKRTKLKGYNLFYDDKSIFAYSSKFDIPGGISSVRVIKIGDLAEPYIKALRKAYRQQNEESSNLLIRIKNSKGVWYYTAAIEFLIGPLKSDKIVYLTTNSCFVYESVNKKVMRVFYIGVTASREYKCYSLSSKTGIDCYLNPRCNIFVVDNTLYAQKKSGEFIQLINKPNADNYNVYDGDRKIVIIGYHDNYPVYLGYYCNGNEIKEEYILERIAEGYNKAHICKSGDNIIGIDSNKEILFFAKGKNCYKKKMEGHGIYVVEDSEDEIRLYYKNGWNFHCDPGYGNR